MIIFRADGNSSVGSGHIMRCLSIANAAKRIGKHCVFVTAGDEFLSIITAYGHQCIILNTDYTHMEAELSGFLPIIYKHKPSVLFVDSYFVTEAYLKTLQKSAEENGGKLIYIDDVSAFPYPCHGLLNYNIYGPDKEKEYRSLYCGAGMTAPKLFLGTAYAPLREEFCDLPDRVVQKRAQKILISTGGTDFEHLTIELVKEVKQCGSQYTFCFVIGAMNEDKEIIHDISCDESRIVLYDNVTQMAELMSDCDVAVSAAGSTLYELCATQTPTITYVLADNQIPGARGFDKRQILENIGDIRDLGAADLSKRLIGRAADLACNYEKRIEISARMQDVVDGKGAMRIVQSI